MEQQGIPAQPDNIKEFSTESSKRRPTPAITHFAVLAVILLPITLLPYAVTRRQLSILRRTVDDVRLNTPSRQDMKDLMTIGAERDRCVQTAIGKMKHQTQALRLEAARRQSADVAPDNMVREDLQQLLSERHHIRYSSNYPHGGNC